MKRKLLLAMAFIASVFTANAQWTGSEPAEGTFFLYNVGAQKFINVGDKAAGWGTNAYLTAEYGLDFIFEANGEAYNLNSRVSNGENSHYLNTAMWCDQGATAWTFTKVDRSDINAYTISNGDSYIVANAAGNDVEYAALSGTERDQWQIIGRADILANLEANTAAGVKRTVATFFISAPDFGRNDTRVASAWPYTRNGGNATVAGPNGNQKNYGCEFWNNTFDIHQDLTDLPNGIYEFEIYGMATNGTSYVYATTTEGTTEKQFKNTSSNGLSFQGVLNAIDDFGGNVTGLFQVTDGKLTIGVKRENNSSSDWCVIDQARLFYYGDYTFAEAYGADLKVIIQEAKAIENPSAALTNAISAAENVMTSGTTEAEFADATALLSAAINFDAALKAATALENKIPTAAYSALNAVVTENNKIYSTADEYTAATENINSVLTSAQALVIPYAAYFSAANDAAIVGVAATTISEQNAAVEEATDVAGIEACTAALKTAVNDKANTIEFFDITSFTIKNAAAQSKDNWEGTDFGGQSDGVTEYWSVSPAGFHQTISLPAGKYRMTVVALQRTNMTGTVYAGEKSTIIAQVSKDDVNNRSQAASWFNAGNGKNYVYFELADAADVVIGLKADETTDDHWTVWKSFALETFDESIAAAYLAPGFAALVEEAKATRDDATYANVTGEERTALQTAIEANPSTVADYEAAVQALNNAVAAFKAAKTNYDIYATERALADAISTDITVAAPTSAENALVQFRALKVAEYNYVKTAYPNSATSKIGEFSTWTRTGTVNGAEKNEFTPLTEQHWSGADMTYYEQPAGGWASSAWTANYEKKTTLPAGDYVIKVAARAASGNGTTAKITCSAAALDGPIFNFGDAGKGITVDGVASFDEGTFCNGGNGRGWVWNYLPFTLTDETEVTMTVVAEGNGTHQWFSVCDGELLSKKNIATAVAYNEADNNTIEDVDLANVTMTRTIKADYNTVVLPFDLTAGQVAAAFGTGTEVYAFTEESANPNLVTVNFNKVIAGTITANVPVLVKATAASTSQVFEGVKVVAPTADVKVAGTNVDFVGVYAPTTIAADNFFVGNGALYKSAGATSIKAFRAYIDAKETGSEVKMFIDGLETSISEIMGEKAENGAIYNLAGQRVQKAQKGIYVINGKKVLVK